MEKMKFLSMLFVWVLLFVNCEDNLSRSPVETGVQLQPEQARQKLKEQNVEFSEYAFLFKIKNNDVETVKLFLAAGMSPETRDTKRILGSSREATAFDHVMSHGQPKMLMAFIEAGANVNATDGSGMTPLMHAAMRADPILVATLVQKGADVNSALGAGWTPLLFAITASSIDPAQALGGMLLDATTGLQAELHGGGNRPQNKKLEAREETEDIIKTVQILLMAGADVNHKMAHGDTPLMFASLTGRPVIAGMLLEAGTDPHATNLSGETALAIAKKNQYLEVVEVLEKAEK